MLYLTELRPPSAESLYRGSPPTILPRDRGLVGFSICSKSVSRSLLLDLLPLLHILPGGPGYLLKLKTMGIELLHEGPVLPVEIQQVGRKVDEETRG